MKSCELCKVPARAFCESDQASLCWECDAKVHGANFLVARHSRTLLCHACQSPTPWKASGARFGNTISVCESCAGGVRINGEVGEESEGGNDDEVETEDDLDDDDDVMDGDDEDDEVGGDEDGDNQVVPWSSTPPPPAASSSSSEESVSRSNNGDRDFSGALAKFSLKRRREDASEHNLQVRTNCSSSQRRCGTELTKEAGWVRCDGEASSVESVRPLKGGETRPASHSASTKESVDRFNGPRGCSEGKTSEAG